MVTLTPGRQQFESYGQSGVAEVYAFETETLSGVIRPGNELPHHGLTRLRHKPTGVELVHPLYAILNLYRVAAVDPARGSGHGAGLGEPRRDGHTVAVDGSTVTLHWPATERRQATTTVRYAVGEPNRIDVDVTVQAHGAYRAFEVFLASYYHPDLEPYAYLARGHFELADEPGRFADEPELVPVVMNDAFRGGIPSFPRDEPGARILLDGRWDGIVRFSPLRYYKVPVLFQADAGRRVAAVWLTDPARCFAVSTGYHSSDPADRFKRHNPQYLSFFGDEIRPGDIRTARARLVVTELDETVSQPLACYQEFLAEPADA
jgi:hypothetical protein